MSVNVKTIPTVLGSNSSSGSVVVTRIGANGLNADQAYFNHIDADSATINNLEANQITTSILNGEIVNGEVVNGTQGNFKELNADVANIYQENVDLSNIKNLYAEFAGVKDLNAKSATIDVGHITELFSGNITTDYLTVLKSAHFFELIIDQIKAVGGSVILSPADGFELYGWSDNINLPAQDASIRLWWIAEEGKNGKYNMWEVGDQALCQNFNNAQVGVSHNVSSKYCWAKVTSTHDNEAKYVVKLNPNAEWTTSSDPAPKDEVTIVTNAVYLATHPTLKKGDFAPVMTQEEKRYDEDDNHKPLNGLWKLNGGTTILTPEEYDALPEADKANYSLYQDAYIAYVNANPIYITLEQYNGEVQYDGYTIRAYSKLEVKKCFSITISKTNADYTYYKESGVTKGSAFNFEEGDNFVQLGCQDESLNRGNAIYLSAYNSIDQDLKAPLIAQYRNITTFDLSGCKWSWFDANGAKFQGQFVLQDGTEIDKSVYDYFKIIPDYNILTKNANNEVDQRTIKVNILANINNTTTYNTVVPTGPQGTGTTYTFRAENCKSNGEVISYTEKTSGQSTASIDVKWQDASFHHMNLKLIKNGAPSQLMDEYILNIQLVSQGSQGTVGPQGPQGDDGDDGTNVTLLVAQELCGVRIDDVSTQEKFETMTTSLYTKLEYKLVQIVGDTATEIDWGSTGYKLTLSCHDGTISYVSNSHDSSGNLNTADGWQYGGNNHDNTKILTFTQSNALNVINPSPTYSNNYRNYQYLMTHYNDSSATYRNRTPLKFKLELKDSSWTAVESRMIYVSYEPQSLFVNNNNMLYSAKISSKAYTDAGVQGAKGYAVEQDQTVIQQTSEAIGLQATRLDNRINGVQYTTSQLTVGVRGIQGSVSELTDDLHDHYYTSTEVDQTAYNISLQVLGQQGVSQEELRRTGIYIEDGSITLDAENTDVTGKLNITDEKSGLVLYDNGSPVISISNESTNGGNISQQVLLTSSTHKNQTISSITFTDIMSSGFNVNAETYSLNNIELYCCTGFWSEIANAFPLSSITLTLGLYKWSDDSLINSLINQTFSNLGGATYYSISTKSFASNYSGRAYFKASITFTFSSSQTVNDYVYGTCISQLLGSANLATKIGNDGMTLLTNGLNKYVQFTPNGYIMKWNDEKIEMKTSAGDDYIYRTVSHDDGGTGTADIGSITTVRTITASSNLGLRLNDSFLIFDNSYSGIPQMWIDTPTGAGSNANKGRMFRIKNMTSGNAYIFTGENTSNTIIHPDEITPRSDYYIFTDSGGIQRTYPKNRTYELNSGEIITMISDGTYWQVFGGKA